MHPSINPPFQFDGAKSHVKRHVRQVKSRPLLKNVVPQEKFFRPRNRVDRNAAQGVCSEERETSDTKAS